MIPLLTPILKPIESSQSNINDLPSFSLGEPAIQPVTKTFVASLHFDRTSISPRTEHSDEMIQEPQLKTSHSLDKKIIDNEFDEFELVEEFTRITIDNQLQNGLSVFDFLQ